MSDDELRRSEMGLGLREDVSIITTAAEEKRVVEAAPVKEPETLPEWVRQNLFSGWVNSTITLVTGAIALWGLFQLVNFVFFDGDWEIIRRFLKGYMVGSFPVEEVWRVWAIAYLTSLLAGISLGASRRRVHWTSRRIVLAIAAGAAFVGFIAFAVRTPKVWLLIAATAAVLSVGWVGGRAVGYERLRRPLMLAWILLFPAAIVILRFIGEGVAPRLWEGFFFNILAAFVGIFASFPIGIALALGRRSTLPAMRYFCIVFIEIFRGVPLVAWLVFSKYVVDLLLPPQLDTADIIKGFIAMTFFSAAYVAEIVRGGLQGVPEGQYEAARALGLSTTRMMALVVMPQALRSTIPAMISHFISLFKDTSLFVAIEVSDLLATARRSAFSPEFTLIADAEVLVFAAAVFWIVAFSMSRWSQRLELRLGVGER